MNVRSRAWAGIRGEGNTPVLTLSTDPWPRADGIQFQSTGWVAGRYGPEAVQVIFLWPSLIGILTTGLSLVADHPSAHMKSLKCDIAITLTVTHGRKSQPANRDPTSFLSLLYWEGGKKKKKNFHRCSHMWGRGQMEKLRFTAAGWINANGLAIDTALLQCW